MERLTFDGNFCDIAKCGEINGGSSCKDGYCSQRKVWERLKQYEDAEAEGRLVVLPCKVGDTVYQLTNKQHARGVRIAPRIVSSFCVWGDDDYALCHQGMTPCHVKDFRKTWFLTKEEAEQALKGEIKFDNEKPLCIVAKEE